MNLDVFSAYYYKNQILYDKPGNEDGLHTKFLDPFLNFQTSIATHGK